MAVKKAQSAQQETPYRAKLRSHTRPVQQSPVKTTPKSVAPKQSAKSTQNWWELAYRSAKGERTPEVLAWQKKKC